MIRMCYAFNLTNRAGPAGVITGNVSANRARDDVSLPSG
jgi:hypothetical protein